MQDFVGLRQAASDRLQKSEEKLADAEARVSTFVNSGSSEDARILTKLKINRDICQAMRDINKVRLDIVNKNAENADAIESLRQQLVNLATNRDQLRQKFATI